MKTLGNGITYDPDDLARYLPESESFLDTYGAIYLFKFDGMYRLIAERYSDGKLTGWHSDNAFTIFENLRFLDHEYNRTFFHSHNYSKLMTLDSCVWINPKEDDVTPGSLPTSRKRWKEREMKELQDMFTKGVKQGVKQGVTDEVGELFLDIAKNVAGENNSLFNSDTGRELGKAMAAVAVFFVVDTISDNTKMIKECAQLQIQTASMRLLQPNLRHITDAISKLKLLEQQEDKSDQ